MNTVSETGGKVRLDELLVARGLFASRSRARDAVARGAVSVGGVTATKPGHAVRNDAEIAVDDPARGYVSRAALKLIAGLDAFGIDPADGDALDVGASTGGFTQVLLERGASRVVALDVGHGQLDATLATDPRVVCLEKLNARDLNEQHLGAIRPNLVVSDVSFISLRLALPNALDLAMPGAKCLLLVKPQFEVGRQGIGKGGLLRDPAEGERVAAVLESWLDGLPGWRALGFMPSPIEGGDGNREFLLAGIKDK